MNKKNIEILRTIVQNPIRFVNRQLDNFYNYSIAKINQATYATLFILVSSAAATIIPYSSPKRLPYHGRFGDHIELSVDHDSGSSAKMSNNTGNIKKGTFSVKNIEFQKDVMNRLSQFPFQCILSIKTSGSGSGIKLGLTPKFYLKHTNLTIHKAGDDIVSYGFYLNGYGLIEPFLGSSEMRMQAYQNFKSTVVLFKDYWFSSGSQNQEDLNINVRNVQSERLPRTSNLFSRPSTNPEDLVLGMTHMTLSESPPTRASSSVSGLARTKSTIDGIVKRPSNLKSRSQSVSYGLSERSAARLQEDAASRISQSLDVLSDNEGLDETDLRSFPIDTEARVISTYKHIKSNLNFRIDFLKIFSVIVES